MKIKNLLNAHPPKSQRVVPSPSEVAAKGHPGTTVKELMDEANKTHERTIAHHKKPHPIAERLKTMMKKMNVL
jgi:hypothetical protein